MEIIINIPKEEQVKNTALTLRVKKQNAPIVKTTLSVNCVLKNTSSNGTLSEQLSEIVNREFKKIRI